MPNPNSLPNVRYWLTVLAATVVAFIIIGLFGFPIWGGWVVFAVMFTTAAIYAGFIQFRRHRR